MSFYDVYLKYSDLPLDGLFETVTRENVLHAIGQSKPNLHDFLALLSPAAESNLEEMAQKAHQLSIQYFGKTITLYTPIYLSNYCTNQCLYCGFNAKNKISRKQLTLTEVENEAQAIAATGLRHILVLTGDAPKIATLDYLKACVEILGRYFTSIGIEIYALTTGEYSELIHAGVDSLTLYQETYNPRLYGRLHVKGPKRDYRFRLDGPERACRAGIRSVNIGALLGLDSWRREVFYTGLHADYLQRYFPEVEIGISLPRLRPHAGDFQSPHMISDMNLVQTLLALRLFVPRAGISVSTRESKHMRDNLIRLGVTKMSAGSTTKVGGRTLHGEDTGQFDICDHRTVNEMQQQIRYLGYQPVFKDWFQFKTI